MDEDLTVHTFLVQQFLKHVFRGPLPAEFCNALTSLPPSDSSSSIDLPVADRDAPQGSLSLLIGPEGGLSEAEQALATVAAFSAVRLGPRVLRTETAPIAALAAIQALWGDFR